MKKRIIVMRTTNWRILMAFAMVLGTGSTWAQVLAPAPDQAAVKDHNVSSNTLKPKVIEDWTTPSLSGTSLVMADPIVGEVDNSDPAFSQELVRVQWRPGDPIDLYIMKPAGVKKPPVILYLYSYPFETDRYLRTDLCRFLTKDGFAAVGFASALTGPRYNNRPMKQWFVSQLRESLATSAHDVQLILNYLDKRGDIDMSRVGMFGDGSGATIAILAAAVDPRIKTLDLLDPWGDWPDWIAKSTLIPEKERPDFLKPEFLAGVAPLDPLKWLPELKTQKIRIQNVKTVTVTPNEAKEKIEAAAPAKTTIVHYDDANAFAQAAFGGKGFDWIKEQLQPGSTQKEFRATGSTGVSDASTKAKQSEE